MKKQIKSLFNKVGLGIVKTEFNRSFPNFAFENIQRRGHQINTVIDIGASDGRWTTDFQVYYPNAQYLLIEAQSVHQPSLERLQTANKNIHVVLAAAGENQGTIYFDASNPFGGQAATTPFASSIEVPVTSLDHEVQRLGLAAPYLIKFDTHGFELPILRGAQETLKQTEVIIMECYNFKIAPEALLFNEMCDYMSTLGFRCIDLYDPLHRLHDHSFWQMDLVFIRSDRPEFQYNKYK